MYRLSIKTKLTLVVSLLLTVILSFLAYFSLRYLETQIRNDISARQASMVSAVATAVDAHILEEQIQLKSIAKSISPTILADPIKLHNNFNKIISIKASMADDISIYSLEGKVIEDVNKSLIGTKAEPEVFEAAKKALKHKTMQTSAPFLSHKKLNEISFIEPLFGKSGKVKAFITSNIILSSDTFLGHLRDVTIGVGGDVYIFNYEGYFITHPDHSRINTKLKRGINRLFDKARDGFDGSGETIDSKGQHLISTFKHFKNVDWILSVNIPKDYVYAPAYVAKKYMLIAICLTVFVLMLVIRLAMGYMTFPLLSLTNNVVSLDVNGENLSLPEIKSRDEIGTLNVEFNKLLMTINLQKNELRERKEFANDLVLSSALPTFVLDAQHRVILWNKACEELTGIAATDMVGKAEAWRAFYNDKRPVLADLIIDGMESDIRSLYMKVERSHLPSGGWHAQNKYSNLINGKDCFTVTDSAPLYDKNGELLAVIETIQDVTERELLARSLRESEERYNFLLSNINLGIRLIDVNNDVLMSNAAFGRIFGKTLKDLPFRKCFSEFDTKDDLCPECPGRIALKTAQPTTLEREEIHNDGSKIVVRISAYPIRNEDGKACQFIEVVEDITELKKAEAEKNVLEHQLYHSQKMEALGTLAGGVAHDFNNILTAVTVYCGVIEMKIAKDSPVQGYLDKILSATKRATALTSGLLAYSRKNPQDLQCTDINKVILNAHDLLSRLVREDINLSVLTTEQELLVNVDINQIGQVLMNIVANACDAMPQGGFLQLKVESINITSEFVKTHGFGKQGEYARVMISDTGTGIDKKNRERIFEPFFTTKEVNKGTGLGLSIVYGIIKQHNGYINVYSEPQKGTTFSIYLPLHRYKVDLPADEEFTSQATYGNEIILLVEDGEDVRNSLRTLLEGRGYSVIEAVDGEDGIQKFQEHCNMIDIVVTDVIMPKKDGKMLCEEIRKNHPATKFILLSGYTSDIIDKTTLMDEGIAFLQKPISTNDFLLRIREVLSR